MKNDTKSSYIYVACVFSICVTIPVSIFIYVYYFKPSLLQESALTVVGTLVAVGFSQLKIIRKFFPNFGMGKLIYKTYQKRYTVALITILLLVIQLVWFVQKVEEIRDRYEYVSLVREAARGNNVDEHVAQLAKAFVLHPARSEVQIIFTRYSRALLFAGNGDYFRSYQKRFIEEIGKHVDLSEFERQLLLRKDGKIENDPLIFYLYLIIEAGADFVGTGNAPGVDTVSAIERYDQISRSVDFSSVHRKMHQLKIDASIAHFKLIDDERYTKFSLDDAVKGINLLVSELPESELSELISSHHYQEFLDQILLHNIKMALRAENAGVVADVNSHLQNAISRFAEILRLRSYFETREQIFWARQPSKLNAFHFYTRLANLPVQSDLEIYDLANESSKIRSGLSALFDLATFNKFLIERNWYVGSPLTFEMSDADFYENILERLNKEW